VRTNGIEWDKLDWRKSDVLLAIELGRSKQRVHQKRKALGKPESILHGYRPKMLSLLRMARTQTINQVVAPEPPYMRYYYRHHLKRLIAKGALELIP